MKNAIVLATLAAAALAPALALPGCRSCPDARAALVDQCPCGIDPARSSVAKDSNGCAVFPCALCGSMDMSAPDLSPFGGCVSIGRCIDGCPTSACAQACFDAADTLDATHFMEALACGQAFCAGAGSVDGGVPRCTKMGDTLVDAPGVAPGSCGRCLDDALAPLFGKGCSSASSPDCDPAACRNARLTCGAS